MSALARLVLPLPDSPMMPSASPAPSMAERDAVHGAHRPRATVAYSTARSVDLAAALIDSAPQARVDDGLHGQRQEHEGDRRDDDQQARRDDPPPVAQEHGARAEAVLEDLAPGRQRRVAQAQEREAGLRQDGRGHEEDELREHVRRGVREDVAPDDVPRRGAQRAGRLHLLAAAQAQDHGADEDGQARPARRPPAPAG